MCIRKAWTALLVTGLLALASYAAASSLRGYVIGNGGTPSNNGTQFLLGTTGQPVVGMSAGANHIVCLGFWCFGGSRVVSVHEPAAGEALPKEFAFGQPLPNPSPRDVSIGLALPNAAHVEMAIFDVSGRRLRNLAAGTLEAGRYVLRWDRLADNGEMAGPGVYFAKLEVDGQVMAKRRIVLTR